MSEKVVETRKFPRFKGRFFTWRQTIFVDQENRSKANFLVFSSGKREAVLRYLWLKLLWDNLNRIEYELFISSLTDHDYMKWSFLKLLQQIPKDLLRQRLSSIDPLLTQGNLGRNNYLNSKGICIEIQKEIRKLPKTKKFSGYIKSLASRGKSSLGGGRIELPPTDPAAYSSEEDQFLVWERLLLP
jgi:hypothetical protein